MPNNLDKPITPPRGVYKRCGPVSEYYNQRTDDWDTYKTGDWLDNWWNNQSDLISDNKAGFAGAFGQWAMGNPDWTCRDDGSDSDCDLSLCDNRVLNDRGDDIRATYYILESVNRLHTYFTGLGEAFTTAALGAALAKDSWATTFYKDKDDKSVTALREVLNAVTTIVGIGASFAGLAGPIAGALAGAGSAIAGGASGATSAVVGQQYVVLDSNDFGTILTAFIVRMTPSRNLLTWVASLEKWSPTLSSPSRRLITSSWLARSIMTPTFAVIFPVVPSWSTKASTRMLSPMP